MSRPKNPWDLPVALGLVLVAGLYGASLLLPAFQVVFDAEEVAAGWDAVAVVPRLSQQFFAEAVRRGDLRGTALDVGYAYPAKAYAVLVLAWLPNPLLWVGALCLLLRRWRAACLLGALALVAGLFLPAEYLRHYSSIAGVVRRRSKRRSCRIIRAWWASWCAP